MPHRRVRFSGRNRSDLVTLPEFEPFRPLKRTLVRSRVYQIREVRVLSGQTFSGP